MTKPVDIIRSRQFVRSAVLPPAPARRRGDGDAVDQALQAGKAQAAAVGSEQVSFATHVAPQWRQYLITCSLALVKTTLDALSSMDQHSPFITLFSRESQQAQAVRFQISLAEQSANGGLTVALMAFGLEAKTTLTQVLYFKSLASQPGDAAPLHGQGVDQHALARGASAGPVRAVEGAFAQLHPQAAVQAAEAGRLNPLGLCRHRACASMAA